MKSTSDYIEEFLSEVKRTIKIKSQSTDQGVITLNVDKTLWLAEKWTVDIDSNKFLVLDIVFNEKIILKPLISTSTITVDFFDLNPVNYLNGTIKMTASEVHSIKDKRELFPLVWLFELIREDEISDPESLILKEVQIRLFFLASADTQNFTTKVHDKKVIKPLNELANSFLSVINRSRFVADETKYTRIKYVNFSVAGQQNNSIFDGNIDAVELNINLKLRKDLNCLNQI